MQIDKYLQEYQPVIYKTFVNALKTNKLSHAYLLSGLVGMPLKEVALFLGKSLLCDNPNPLACNECITCMRVDEGNYADVMVFGDGNTKIKKGDILLILSDGAHKVLSPSQIQEIFLFEFKMGLEVLHRRQSLEDEEHSG